MKAKSFSLNDFDFIISALKLSGVNGKETVVQNPISILFYTISKLLDRRMRNRSCQKTPVIQSFFSPGSGGILPEFFELVFEDIYL